MADREGRTDADKAVEPAGENEIGGSQSTPEMFAMVYDELRRLAAARLVQQNPAHTLSATALVHEAYLRLAKSATGNRPMDRPQFLAVAAKAMQNILVDHARRKRAEKRGGDAHRFVLHEADRYDIPEPETLLTVHEALEKLVVDEPLAADIARMRLFAGLSIEEAAEALGMSRASAYREWNYARAFIETALTA